MLALYAFAVFGYVTATIASFFVDRDADRPDAAVAGRRAIEALQQEIAALRAELTGNRSGNADGGLGPSSANPRPAD
jgi:voltage-gated potassium channel